MKVSHHVYCVGFVWHDNKMVSTARKWIFERNSFGFLKLIRKNRFGLFLWTARPEHEWRSPSIAGVYFRFLLHVRLGQPWKLSQPPCRRPGPLREGQHRGHAPLDLALVGGKLLIYGGICRYVQGRHALAQPSPRSNLNPPTGPHRFFPRPLPFACAFHFTERSSCHSERPPA